MAEMDNMGPWNRAVSNLLVAVEAIIDVAVLTGNHAPEPREACAQALNALLILERGRERERLARNQIAAS
jgi:hypothetical protein